MLQLPQQSTLIIAIPRNIYQNTPLPLSEPDSETAIREAVQGVRGIMAYSMRMVPINDMTTVMTVTPKKKPGEFVVIGKDHLISSSIMLFI